jgi:tetratricopeptide (TPR) repeat protein
MRSPWFAVAVGGMWRIGWVIVRRVILTILSLAMLFIARPIRAASTTAPSKDVESLILKLADPDPAIRDKATEALSHVSLKDRPALVRAAQSTSPQISSRAAEILMKLPWYLPSDPPDVRRMLVVYGTGGIEQRAALMTEIGKMTGSEPALLRLAQEEPSDAVAWQAVAVLRRIENPEIRAKLCKVDLTDARPQVLALAARAMFPGNPATALDILRRLIESDSTDAVADGMRPSETSFAYTLLVADALESGDRSEAARVLRTHASKAGTESDAANAVMDLFAFYADHGLTDDFADDFQTFSASLGKPEIMYALARIEKSTGGSHLIADALAQSAQASAMAEPYEHHRVAEMLYEREWFPEAIGELYAMLATSDDANLTTKVQREFDAHGVLSHIAETCEEHTMVAEHVRGQLDAVAKIAGARDIPDEEFVSKINWHLMAAARRVGNMKRAEEYYHKLSDTAAGDIDAVIEVVDYLKSTQRAADAAALFEKCYKLQKPRVAGAREDDSLLTTTANALNNVAWVSASCGERVKEAVEFSQRALALEPETYAYLDTAATAQFAAGNRDEAIRLEKRAQLMRPNDPFIAKQLIRFQGTEAHRHEGTKEE